MRILVLSHVSPPAVSGGSSHLYSIGDCLKKLGHQLLTLSSNCNSTDDFINPKSKSSLTSPNLLPVYKSLHQPLKLISPILSKGPLFKIIPFSKSILTIKQFNPDYILAGPFPTTISLYASFFQKITSAKLVIIPCFHPTDKLFSHPHLTNCFKNCHLIFALTNFEKNYLSKNFNINPKKIKIIPSGIKKTFFKKTATTFPKKPTILYLGSFSAHKGIDILIKSIPPNCQLVLAGQKTLHWPQIKKQIKALSTPIRKNIKTVFNFKNKTLSKLIDSTTCLVLPSSQESFGKVLIETWARKKPVIVKNIPALIELVNASHGGLIFKKNLQQQIQRVITKPKLSKQLGQNGFNYVNKHSTWDKIGTTVQNHLKQNI